jgi:hypothetical protein
MDPLPYTLLGLHDCRMTARKNPGRSRGPLKGSGELKGHYRVEGCGRGLVLLVEDMNIDIDCERHGFMTEALGDDFHRNALIELKRCKGVPKRVKGYAINLRPLRDPVEPLSNIVAI